MHALDTRFTHTTTTTTISSNFLPNSGGSLGGGSALPCMRGLFPDDSKNHQLVKYCALSATDALIEINKTHFTTPGTHDL